MYSCATEDQLERFLHDELEEPARASVTAHVEECTRCQLALERLTSRSDSDATSAADSEETDRVARVLERVQKKGPRPPELEYRDSLLDRDRPGPSVHGPEHGKMDNSSASLLDRLRSPSEPAAWDQFVRLYTPLLCHWVRRLGVPPREVEDLVQDVFAVLVRTLPVFRHEPGQRFRGWLWNVTVNKARERRRRPMIARQAGEQELCNLAESDPAAEFDDKEYAQFVARQAAQLVQVEFQPLTWRAFWEYVVADRPASIVARELGMTENAIYIAKGRVLRCLRRKLDGLLD